MQKSLLATQAGLGVRFEAQVECNELFGLFEKRYSKSIHLLIKVYKRYYYTEKSTLQHAKLVRLTHFI